MLARTFEEDLARAVEFHGHLCGGQVLGTRIARAALEYLGIADADGYRDLVGFVEADRCLADAITVVANCHLGKRCLKWYDYGKLAATFYDIPSRQAVRIFSLMHDKPPEGADIVQFFNGYSDAELLRMQQVELPNLTEDDLPGHARTSVICAQCGEKVVDNRAVERDGRMLCKACAGEHVYYRVLSELEL